MPLIGIVARKKDIKDIKRKLGENYELIELNSESIKNKIWRTKLYRPLLLQYLTKK